MNTKSYLYKLSLKKIFNFLKLFVSFYISYILKKPVHWGMPSNISIEPTNYCNLGCKECPTGMKTLKRSKIHFNLTLYRIIINELHNKLISLILYFQGEPYINSDLAKMTEMADHKKIYTYCSTNGHYLDNENSKRTVVSGLDELIISLDGTTQEVYESYRQGGSLEKVLEGSRNVVSWKKKDSAGKPFIKFQFLVVRTNEHQIEEAKLLAKKVGVDKIVFKSAQIYDFKNGNPLIPENGKYSRYRKQDDGGYLIKSALKNRCWRMWSNPVITVDGSVIPCCFDKDAKHTLGNLYQNSFAEIWNSKKYQSFRQQILTNRKSIDICRNCTEGLKVGS